MSTVTKQSSTALDQSLTDFLKYLETVQKRDPETIKNYNFYLRRFIKFAKSKNVKHPKNIKENLVKQFQNWLNKQTTTQGDPLKSSTKNYHLVALRSWLKYLVKQNVPTVEIEKIKLRKIPIRQQNFLFGSELESLLDIPGKINQLKILKLRDKAILEVLFSAGLKVSELVSLKRKDLNLKKDTIKIIKNNKSRNAILTQTAKHWLKHYLSARRDKNPFLFIRQDRAGQKPNCEKPLTPRSVQRMVEKYGKMAGITKQVTPHILRHSFANNQLLQGEDIKSVQMMLGRSSFSRELKNFEII